MKNHHFYKRILFFLLCLGLIITNIVAASALNTNAEYSYPESDAAETPEVNEMVNDEWKAGEAETGEAGMEHSETNDSETDASETNDSETDASETDGSEDTDNQFDETEEEDGLILDGDTLETEVEEAEELDLLTDGFHIINEHTVEVSTYAAFAEALRTADYTDIYFGSDITATAPATLPERAFVHASKSEQRIYGHAYSGSGTFTFTQFTSSSEHYPILVLNGSALTKITIKNMNIIGFNGNGVVRVEADMRNVITSFENITFKGPQFVKNNSGTAHFTNVNGELSSGSGVASGRLSDAHHVIFSGENTIHTVHSSTANPVFYMTKFGTTAAAGDFRIERGADVKITTPAVLFHSDSADNSSPVLLFDQQSSFEAQCGQGFTDHFFNEIKVAPYASVKLTQNATGDGFAVRLRKNLLVEEGAVFEVLRPVGGTGAIQMHTPGTITFNNPERVVIYANSNLLFGCMKGTLITINTNAINLWDYVNGGSSEGVPTNIWNKLGTDTLSVSVPWTADNVMGTVTSNLDMEKDPVLNNIDNANFTIRRSQMMVLGRIGLTVEEISSDYTTISGVTESEAWLSGSYTTADGGNGIIGSVTAKKDGTYKLPLSSGPPLDNSRLYVTAYKKNLRMRQYLFKAEEEQILQFLSVPDLQFEHAKIPYTPTYIKRADPDWEIIVRDTRRDSTGFKVQASIDEPMTAVGDDVYTLPNALVYVDDSGRSIPLTSQPLTVFINDSGSTGDHTVGWDETKGVLLLADPSDYQRAGLEYSTTINWTLVSAP